MGRLGDCLGLVPRTPPEGLLDWAGQQEKIGPHGLLYEMEWVEERDLSYYMCPGAKARKVKMVLVQCSCCGENGYFHYGRDGNGQYGFVHPDSYDADRSDIPTVDGDLAACLFCGEPVRAIRRANI